MQGAAGLLGWLEATPLSHAMRASLWLYPIVEIFHILGFSILFGTVAMFDLRVLGFSRALPLQALGWHLLRWSAASFLLIVPAGLMMFSAHPEEFINNPVFLTKLLLIVTAGLNALAFHAGVYRSVAQWNTALPAPLVAKAQATLSLALWVGVISCGRLLAYT